MTRLILFFFTVSIFAFPIYAKEWCGLIPMKSTCDDVKRVLGVTTCEPPNETYDLGDERVRISFSKYSCFPAYTKFWNVPVGTIIIIERHPKNPIPVAELDIDIKKYEVTSTDTDINIYSNAEDGLSFWAANGFAMHIYYMPKKDDERLQCTPEIKKPNTPKKERSKIKRV